MPDQPNRTAPVMTPSQAGEPWRPDLSPEVRRALEAKINAPELRLGEPGGVILLTVDEAAALLGIDRDAMLRLGRAGGIRTYNPHGEPRFDLADVRRFDRTKPIPSKSSLRRQLRTSIRPSVRWAVLERDGFRCVYCGSTPAESRLVLDHVISVADGGTDDEDNLAVACEECNAGKGRRSIR